MSEIESATQEDRRTAVQISINLSIHLLWAALTVLIVEGVYIAFASGERDIDTMFWIAAIVSVVALIISMIIAVITISISRDFGLEGNWNILAAKRGYGRQAFFGLVGLIAFGGVVLSTGGPDQEAIRSELRNLENQIRDNSGDIINFGASYRTHDLEISDLNRITENLEATLTSLTGGEAVPIIPEPDATATATPTSNP